MDARTPPSISKASQPSRKERESESLDRLTESPSPTSTVQLPQQSSAHDESPSTNLPPLVMANRSSSVRHSQRVPSYASKRLSAFSVSGSSANKSRPQSSSFPAFHSSLDYTLVRDFAYQPWHPLHYGPDPDQTPAVSTPIDEIPRRLSEPASNDHWDEGLDPDEASFHGAAQLPATYYGDGPPWREDDDLHSPVVTSSKHKRTKSSQGYFNFQSQNVHESRRPSYASSGTGDGGRSNELYYTNQPGAMMNGASTFTSYPPNHHDIGTWQQGEDGEGYYHEGDFYDEDDSRYSKTYTFSIASPDEEMNGKAVALFDFARENDNELPLVEGQVLWVSYRHGQGWLVAQDPKSGESGLVPEEYVRLLRDIEGGLSGLNGHLSDESPVAVEQQDMSPASVEIQQSPPPLQPPQQQTQQQASPPQPILSSVSSLQRPAAHERTESQKSLASGQFYDTPVISHFSTSSKDLQPYPQHLLGSQASTPISTPDAVAHFLERSSTDGKRPASSRSTEVTSSTAGKSQSDTTSKS